jgi:hypothetical protein
MNWKRGFRRIAFVFGIFAAIFCAGLAIISVLLASSIAHNSLRWAKESYSQKYDPLMFNNPTVKVSDKTMCSGMDVAQFRLKYPEYNDMNDVELVSRLHRKFYSDIPFEKFALAFGVLNEPNRPKVPSFEDLVSGKVKSVRLDQIPMSKEESQLTLDQRLESLVPSTEEAVRMELLRRFQAKQEKQEAEAEIKKLESGFWITLPAWGLIGLCGLAGSLAAVIGFSVIWLMYKLLEWLALGFCGK